MKLAFIFLGVALILLGWWESMPVTVWILFWPIQVPNLLWVWSTPTIFAGWTSIIYGVLAGEIFGKKKAGSQQ